MTWILVWVIGAIIMFASTFGSPMWIFGVIVTFGSIIVNILENKRY